MDPLNRKLWITTPPTPKPLLFERMTGEEELGRPFRYEVDLLCESSEIDLESLLGKKMTVTAEHKQGERHFNGVCTQFRVLGTTHRYVRYRASLRPDLSLLAYSSNCRIFQKRTVPEILRQLFKDRVTFEQKLTRDYRKWEYLVQYRESDLNFVSRLMEQEGIYFYFTHDAETHKLVLLDETSSCSEAAGYAKVPYFPPEERGRVKEEHVSGWTAGARIVPGKFTVRDFKFEKPTDLPTSTVTSQLKAAGSPRAGADYEVYDYPGEHTSVEEARAEARNRLLEHESWYANAEALADTRGLGVGHRFTITNLPRQLQSDKPYVVVKASYTLQGNYFESDGTPVDAQEYKASYTLIDAKTEYRTPRQTPRPIVQGPQTATVVGRKTQPKKEEICTDEFGRVLVKFHWDRRGEDNGPEDDPEDKDKEQSCFIRVSQLWAGSGFGGMHIPRIGQEVIVDFLEGDPDRPIITGRVYNGDNKVPFTLTANATQSGIKSRSSFDATPNNYNELRFEDKKGSEEVYLQAEKDQKILVKNDESHTVGHDRVKHIQNNETVTVDGNRSETVHKDETIGIDGKRDLTVGTNHTIMVGAAQRETIGAASTETVGAMKQLTVGASYDVSVAAAMSVTVGGAMTESTSGSKTVSVSKNSEAKVTGDSVTTAKNIKETAQENVVLSAGKNFTINGKKGLIDMGDELTLKVGSATISLKKNGDITIKGGKINIQGSGDVIVKGSKISEN
jgi:type VI secretion system secreted protein VgrG